MSALVYYVYVLFRETGIPFYVGMGKGDRWLSHERSASLLRTHRDRLIAKALETVSEIPKVKVRENLTKQEAFKVEIALIAAIGREPEGPLINQTSGGDGTPGLSEEVVKASRIKAAEKLRGRKRPPDVIAKITATKRARAAADKALKVIPDHQPKIPKIRLSFRHSEETKRLISQGVSKATRGKSKSLEHRAKISEAQRGRKERPEQTTRRIQKSRAAYMQLTPEQRSDIARRGWETKRREVCESSSR